VAQGKGLLTMLAVAWVERGGVDPNFAVGVGDELWGHLFGLTGLRQAPAGAQKLTRYVRGVWVMGGPIHFATEDTDDDQLTATKGTYPNLLSRRAAVGCEVSAGGKSGAMVPVLGSFCGLERSNICFAFSETRLTALKRATETVALFLSLIDCQDWETGVMQLCLRSENYLDQMKAECKLVEALQHGPTPYGVHPMTGKEFQRADDLWQLVMVRSSGLSTPEAITAWSCFLLGEALLQLSFVFGDEGATSAEVDADVEAMVDVVKQVSKLLDARQMLVVSIYVSGAGCEPHRAIMLLGTSAVVYYDPSGNADSQSDHHRLRSTHIRSYLRQKFGVDFGTSFSDVAGVDAACPQGAKGSCDTNCNAHCMVAVISACYAGLQNAMPVMCVARRLGVKVMDTIAAILPSALVKFAVEHRGSPFEPECSKYAPLGGWQPSVFDHYQARFRFERSMPEWRKVILCALAVDERADGPASACFGPASQATPDGKRKNTAGALRLSPSVQLEPDGCETASELQVVVLGDIGAGTGSTMRTAWRRSDQRAIEVKVGISVEPDTTLLWGPHLRGDELYRQARFIHTVEELEPTSEAMMAVNVFKASLPCAPNAMDLFDRFLGFPTADSRAACMIALAGLIASCRKGLWVIENTRGFETSLLCTFIRNLVSACGGGSMLWVGYGAHYHLPSNGVRVYLFVANVVAKHLLAGIEVELRSRAPSSRMRLSDVLRKRGNSQPVSEDLVLVRDKTERGGSFDGPRRISTLTRGGAFVAVAYGADLASDVAARQRVARTALVSMGAYVLGDQCLEFTRAGVCAVTGTEPELVSHLSNGDEFRALGGIAHVGIEEAVWDAVLSSLVAHASVWREAFALGPRMPDDPLTQVVQRHVSTFSSSLCLNVLPWKGQTLMAQFDGFAELPWLRVCVAGQLPPVAHLQLQAKTGLMLVVAWLPLSDDVSSTALELDIVPPTTSMMQLLQKASEVCGVPVPQFWSRENLKAGSPPVGVLVMQAVSASRVHLPLVRELLLRRCCALLRIRLLDAAGIEKFLEELLAIAMTARFRMRYENGDSAIHGDPVSAGNSVMITLLFLPLFADWELQPRSIIGVPARGTMFRGAQGDAQNTLIPVALSIGATLDGVPDGTVDGAFKRTGLTRSRMPGVLDRHRPLMRTAIDGSSVLSINSTLPHASSLSDVALNDDRIVLSNGESLLRRILDVEVLSALGFASVNGQNH
jgi:hypothetical protein